MSEWQALYLYRKSFQLIIWVMKAMPVALGCKDLKHYLFYIPTVMTVLLMLQEVVMTLYYLPRTF